MTEPSPLDHEALIRRISRELADGFDEELELEIEDRYPLPGDGPAADDAASK